MYEYCQITMDYIGIHAILARLGSYSYPSLVLIYKASLLVCSANDQVRDLLGQHV